MEENKQPSIFQLKRQYKRLFLIKVKDYDIVFRLLTWGDMKIVRSFLSHSIELQNAILDDIFGECVIEHNIPDIDAANAGIVPSVANLIIGLSCYKTPDDFINQMASAREKSDSFEGQIEAILSKAFVYQIKDIDTMLTSDVLSELGKAEKILTGVGLPDLPIRLESESPGPSKQRITKPTGNYSIPSSKQPPQQDTKVPPEGKKPFIVNVEEENRILQEMLDEDD